MAAERKRGREGRRERERGREREREGGGLGQDGWRGIGNGRERGVREKERGRRAIEINRERWGGGKRERGRERDPSWLTNPPDVTNTLSNITLH